jgi:hypothetical protein
MLEARIHHTDDRLAFEVMKWSEKRYGRGIPDLAALDFCAGLLDPTLLMNEDLPMEQFFLPWWIHGWRAGEDSELPPALEYLAEIGAPKDSFEHRFARAAASSPFTFYRIAGVEQGRTMRLEDVLTGAVREVRESSGAEDELLGAYLFARVVTLDGLSVLIGSGPLLLEPSLFPRIKELRGRLQERTGKALTERDLHEHAEGIRAVYLNLVAQILDPSPPRVTNTDGDEMAPTRLVYDLRCSCEEAFQALWTLAEGHERSELLRDAERDGKGTLRAVEFNWVREGANASNPAWSNTILGRISIDEGTMEVEVNSRERADRIREEIDERLGGKAVFRHAVMESIEKMMEEAAEMSRAGSDQDPGPTEDGEHEDLPEVREAVAKMAARHWEGWFEHPIPALENRTPRDAVKTAEGRELLEALLADYARKNRMQPGSPWNPDIEALRRELGLE